MAKRELAIERSAVQQACWYAMNLMDDESEAEDQREQARQLFKRLSDLLLYQPHGADGSRSIRLVPATFHVTNYYTRKLDELELELGLDVVQDNPVRMRMARQAAALVDNTGYSTDFRLESEQVLDEIIEGLRRIAAEEDQEGDDDA